MQIRGLRLSKLLLAMCVWKIRGTGPCPGVRGVTESFCWCFAWPLRRVRSQHPGHGGLSELQGHYTVTNHSEADQKHVVQLQLVYLHRPVWLIN